MEVDAPTAIFGVHRDTRFQSRFTVVFKNKLYIDLITKNGLQVGETKIAPIKPKPTRGYIPNLPIYASDEEVRDLLSNHGNVVGLHQRTREDGIGIGGWNFFIHLNERMPDHLTYEQQHYEVIYQGKTKQIPITKVQTAPPPKKTKTDTPAKEQLPFPDSPITVILETQTPPIRTPKNRETGAPTRVIESRKGEKRTIRKRLRLRTEEILENTDK